MRLLVLAEFNGKLSQDNGVQRQNPPRIDRRYRSLDPGLATRERSGRYAPALSPPYVVPPSGGLSMLKTPSLLTCFGDRASLFFIGSANHA